MNSAKHHVLLTGVTGFVGKVVLGELIRRREELGLEGVSVIVRKKTQRDGTVLSAAARFDAEVAASPAMQNMPPNWQRLVTVVEGDLEQSLLGHTAEQLEPLFARVTHLIHGAASVEFDLPIAEAAKANVTSALNVLELARSCRALVGMVYVSTAYVTVWREGAIQERLAHMPRAAEENYRAILDASRPEAEMLAESGHPNTYTYTKCLAEHLLSQRRGSVPLTIVRPSIISASWQYPVPGWIDSRAAFAGCLLYTGLGVIKVWNANPGTRLDVVPVDLVAQRVIDAVFLRPMPAPGEDVPVRYAAMGVRNAMRSDLSAGSTVRFFRERPGGKFRPHLFIGKPHHGFHFEDMLHRAVPLHLMASFYGLTGRPKQQRQLQKANERIRYLNSAFHYFTNHTFDFRPSEPPDLPGYSPHSYIDLINRGMYRHLLSFDETELTLAGEAHNDARNDFTWATEKDRGNSVHRALGVTLRKVLRRCTSRVTFDRLSFERAIAEVNPGSLFVLAPSHRSYFDFLLLSYLCFQHPELGIPMPHIAAAEEFSRIPVVGRILSQAQAFYVRRGVGSALPEVNQELERVAGRGGSLMFFIEGQRSRGRNTLPPKRGLLRALQATGREFAVLPIAVSYERVPEEQALLRELSGGARSRMSVKAIVEWTAKAFQGRVELGRVHIACGQPQELNLNSDVRALAERIVAEQQHNTVISRFHLRVFLSQAKLEHVDEEWLVAAIQQRGGRVLASETTLPSEVPPALEQSLRNQWVHWFYPDALALFPDDPAIRDHVARYDWARVADQAPPSANTDLRLRELCRELFRPVIDDYALVAERAKSQPPTAPFGPRTVIREHPSAYLPRLEDAFRALSERGAVAEVRPGEYHLTSNDNDQPEVRP